MKTQKYSCPKCGLESSVKFEDGADFYTVLQQLRDDHRTKAPDCQERDFKVVNTEFE